MLERKELNVSATDREQLEPPCRCAARDIGNNELKPGRPRSIRRGSFASVTDLKRKTAAGPGVSANSSQSCCLFDCREAAVHVSFKILVAKSRTRDSYGYECQAHSSLPTMQSDNENLREIPL